MKNVFLTIVFISFITIISCGSKKNVQQNTTHYDSFKRLKAKMKLYRGDFYPKYEGEITIEKLKDTYIFHYKDDRTNYEITVSNKYYSDFLPLFEKGLLYPQLISCFRGSIMSVGQFEELSKSSDGTKRSYKLWSWCENCMNPCEYTIKLLNEKATESTSNKDFIKNAIVVYVSQCSVII